MNHGLRDRPDEGVVALKCTPDVEARVFEGGYGHETFARLGEVRCPVTVAVGAEGPGPAASRRPWWRPCPRGGWSATRS